MHDKIVDPGSQYYRFLLYGRSKSGKTTLASTAQRVLILDPEEGTRALSPREGLGVWHIRKWEDLDEAYRYLRDSDHEWEWVVVDGITRLHSMALRFVMKLHEKHDLSRIPGMVQRSDYGKAGELLKGLFYNLHSLPVGLIFTAQERLETEGVWDDEDEESQDTRLVPDLPKGARTTITALVDGIGRVYTHPVSGTLRDGTQVRGSSYRLYMAPLPALDTGFRSRVYKGRPPYLKNPTIDGIIKLIDGQDDKGESK